MGSGEVFEDGVVVSPIEVVRQRNGIILSRSRRFVEHHDPVCVRVRQRSQQYCIDDAKDGRVRADAECESENRDGRKRRVLNELPNRETEITHSGAQSSDRRASRGAAELEAEILQRSSNMRCRSCFWTAT